MGLFPALVPEQTNSSNFHFRYLAEALILWKSWWESREGFRELPGDTSSRHLTTEEEISKTCPASLGTKTNFYPWGGLEVASEQMFLLQDRFLKHFCHLTLSLYVKPTHTLSYTGSSLEAGSPRWEKKDRRKSFRRLERMSGGRVQWKQEAKESAKLLCTKTLGSELQPRQDEWEFEYGPECKHATVTSDLFRAHPIHDTERAVLRGGHSGMRLEL